MAEKTTTVVVETPRGSRAKFAFDGDRHAFVLKRALPSGMAFPFDFGFVPNTLAEDGDPLDAIVLWEAASFPGCVLECRVIGAMAATQRDAGKNAKRVRNDRLLVVPEEEHELFRGVRSLADVSQAMLRDLEAFFRAYHAIDDGEFTPLARLGPKAARGLVEKHRHG